MPHTEVDKVEALRTYVEVLQQTSEDINALAVAKKVHDALVGAGLLTTDDDIKYDFDQHYYVPFLYNGVKYAFEVWNPWQHGLSWTLGLAKTEVA